MFKAATDPGVKPPPPVATRGFVATRCAAEGPDRLACLLHRGHGQARTAQARFPGHEVVAVLPRAPPCTCAARPICPALPGAGRRVPAQRRRQAGIRCSARAKRRVAAGGVAQDHHPIDASCSTVGGCWSTRRVQAPWPTTTALVPRPRLHLIRVGGRINSRHGQSGGALLRFAALAGDAPPLQQARALAPVLLAQHGAAARAHVLRWLDTRADLLKA